MFRTDQYHPQGEQGGPSAPEEFYSTEYPSIYRETVIHKDERGHYIDPFKGLASKPYGRRLMYDQSHPEVRSFSFFFFCFVFYMFLFFLFVK